MTIRDRVMWGLRIYGPCPVAELMLAMGMSRAAVLSGLTALRAEGLAERTMRANYRLTERGRATLRELERQQRMIATR